MHVLLVGPNREENLSIRYLSASLLAAGHEADLASFDSIADAPAVTEAAARADIVGLSMCFQARAPEFLELARRIRSRNPGALMVAGGHYASCAAQDLLLRHPELDLIVIHEGEQAIVEIADQRERGSGPLSEIRGIAFREGSQVTFSPPRPMTEDLDSLHTPDRRGPVRLVAGVPTAYMCGSRGCLNSCHYCCISTLHTLAPGRHLRQRDPRRIVDEMADLYYGRGIRQFIFHDDNFLVPSEAANHRRLDAFEKALQEKGLGRIGLYMKCRPGDVTPGVLRRLRDMGLVRFFMGIESSSARGFASLGRTQTAEECERALQICDELGVPAQYTLLIFHPDATMETIESDVRFMRRHINHPLNFGRAELHAGTPLERRMLAAGRARGSYLARGYGLLDPTADLVCALWKRIFRERCPGEEGLMNTAILLNYSASVMDRFYSGAQVQRLSEEIEEWRLRVTRSSLDLLTRLIACCRSVRSGADPRLIGLVGDLKTEEETSARALLSEGEQLHRRLDALTLRMVGLEEHGGRMRRIAGYKGSVAGHVMAVALAFQLAGTMWASGSGCDMEERILDADQDGLNDDLERQVFGTSLFTSDTDADGIPDGQEDHDDDGITNRDEQRNIQALGQAASEGDLATVRLLLRTGVQLDATDPVSGLTALACAARSGKEDVVTALLKAGADVNAAAWSSHFTPLMAAAGSGRASVVRLLLRAGADVNAQNEDGNTALWIASRYGRDEIVAILRSAGASR